VTTPLHPLVTNLVFQMTWLLEQ